MGQQQKKQYMHIGIPEREEKEKGTERLFKKKIPLQNQGREMNIQIHETQRTAKKTTSRHIIIKLTKDKDRTLKTA